MTDRYRYEFKKFKSGKQKGKEYFNKYSVKTGKLIDRGSTKQKLRTGKRTVRDQHERKETTKRETKFVSYAATYGGNVNDIREAYEKRLAREIRDEKRRVKKERKVGKKPTGRKKKTLKQEAMLFAEKTTGYITVWRIWWVIKVGRDTPYISARGSGTYDGNQMKHAVKEVNIDSMPSLIEVEETENAEFVSGSGACVRLIDRDTQATIEHYEMGAGCTKW